MFHVAPVSLGRPHLYNILFFPECHLTKDYHVWNQIILMPHCGVALVDIWAVPLLLIIVYSCLVP